MRKKRAVIARKQLDKTRRAIGTQTTSETKDEGVSFWIAQRLIPKQILMLVLMPVLESIPRQFKQLPEDLYVSAYSGFWLFGLGAV